MTSTFIYGKFLSLLWEEKQIIHSHIIIIIIIIRVNFPE